MNITNSGGQTLTIKFPDTLKVEIAPLTLLVGDADLTQGQKDLVTQITNAFSAALAAQLAPIQQEISQFMADFTTDEAKLETDIQANTDAITKVGTLVAQDKTTIADLNSQIAVLKANQVDTTALEASLGNLEKNNAALSGLTPAPPTPPTTGPAPTA